MKVIPIGLIDANEGQIEGLPKNPRKASPEKRRKLKNSILQDPEMLSYRGLLVYPHKGRYVAIGGNMRLSVLKELGYENVPCEVIENATIEAVKRYIVKDNGSFGEWDYNILREEFEPIDLEAWDVDLPPLEEIAPEKKTSRNLHWGDTEKEQPKSDLIPHIELHEKEGSFYISFFRKAKEGIEIKDIKADMRNIPTFASQAENVLRMLMTLGNRKDWCLITTPKRRHLTENFAEAVCKDLSERIRITFYPDIIRAQNKDRIHPLFELTRPIEEKNIILFDDIITTGATIKAVKQLLPLKNIITVIGIYNN